MRLNNCLIVLTIIIVSVANGEDAHEFMKNHHHHSDQQTKQENILQLECQISAVLQPGNISKFYYLSHRDGEPLTILVTPCSGPVSWTVTSYDTPENNRHQGVDSGCKKIWHGIKNHPICPIAHPSWRLNELIPGSSPLFSYDGDEAQNFTIPCVRAGLYRLEIKTPVDSNKMVRIPKTVLLYATSSPLDHLPISYENTRGNKKRRALRFIPRRNRKRLTVSWSKSHVNPHLSTYCLAVTSGGLPHPPTLCAAKNVLETHSHSRGSSSKEHVHKANPTGLHCVNQTRITLHGLDYDTTYNFTLYVVSKRNNLSTRVASESLKYKKIQAQVLLTDRYVSANLQENFGIINFRYQPQYNKSTEFHVLPCGGGIVKAKLRGPGIKRKKEVTNLELLRAPPLEPGKKYTLRISAIPQELSKVSSVRVLARQAGSIEYPKVPSKKPPREYTPLTNCTEVTVGVEPVGAAEYCVLARELRGTTQLKHSAITSIPDQCGLYRRRRSEYTFDHCENRTDSPRKAEIFKITRLQPGKYYQVQITAQIHGQSLSYPLIKVRTKENCLLRP